MKKLVHNRCNIKIKWRRKKILEVLNTAIKEFYVVFPLTASLIQLRGQKRSTTVCTVKNGIIDDDSTISLGGVGTRGIIEGKTWGFS